ncbi:hypothetical protein PIB30_053676 [Stylosanthes scabra]|uniref:Transposase MuDR plant domain-containing protein n=1 Tax=Stylosanthes scabra TaxID=79078 RepID=A0ABU6TIA8_9FABA|nr:hypothetical protein [Stylosanthes scabra]
MEFGSRMPAIAVIRNYTISKVVDYMVFESEPTLVKCKKFGNGCSWLMFRPNSTTSLLIARLAKQKSIVKIYGEWEASYGTLPVWCKVICDAMKGAVVEVETLPCYDGGEELEDVKILHKIF